ncbi:MAG: SPOR domain-containing protein [Paludibacteraceae bacterium]|nr:SPOR domain-containing protein [Paludibacteraceae bacterium]
MKKVVLLLATAAISLAACSQKYYPAMYQPAEASPVARQMSLLNDTAALPPAPVVEPVAPEPAVRITETTDRYTFNGNDARFTYYIVVGSFANADNAARMRQDLVRQGIAASVASNDKGMHRVVLDEASDDEAAIRNSLARLRRQFPDAWILKLSR